MSYAACVDNDQVRFLELLDIVESEPFEQLSNLLAFILIDFAAKGVDGKSIHNML